MEAEGARRRRRLDAQYDARPASLGTPEVCNTEIREYVEPESSLCSCPPIRGIVFTYARKAAKTHIRENGFTPGLQQWVSKPTPVLNKHLVQNSSFINDLDRYKMAA